MIKKLTLTVEEEVITYAKKYASEKGSSLSELVEDYFKSLADPGSAEKLTKKYKISKVKGAVQLPQSLDVKKEVRTILAKKIVR